MRIAHVSIYPNQGQKHISDSGVASYAKNLLTNMPAEKLNVYVLCNRVDGKSQRYVEDNMVIVRCFDRGFKFIGQISKQLRRLKPDVVHIQHEIALFGGLLSAFLVPLLIMFWRKKTVITLHGVVSLARLDKRFVNENNYAPAPVWLVRLGLTILYVPITWLARRVIVHEPHFKQILTSEYGVNPAKISVVPHGVENFTAMSKSAARRQLKITNDQKVVLFMGYAAGYKGIDLLIEGFSHYAKTHPDALLLIGAGEHPKLKYDMNYRAKYTGYKQLAKKKISPNQYRWVGFIPENEVVKYYSAADISVYPYLMAMASSGPMSFAMGLSKPFLASRAFEDVFDEQFIFDPTPDAMAEKLDRFFANTKLMSEAVLNLRSQRLWPLVSQKTVDVYRQVS